jgi:hypothetical protein
MIDETMSLARIEIALGRSTFKDHRVATVKEWPEITKVRLHRRSKYDRLEDGCTLLPSFPSLPLSSFRTGGFDEP